jgi:pyruvate dehydrogenase E1 component
LFTTGPGPDTGGSKPGWEGCDQIPEKSAIEVAPWAALLADGTAVGACPKAGVAAAAASVTQSIAEPLIGMAQDGLAAFEPAYVDELAVILAFALDYIQRDGDGEVSERNWLRDKIGGSIYLRLSTRPIEQNNRIMTSALRQAIVDGAYWLRAPGPNCEVVVAYMGAVAPEAIQATGLMAEDRRDVGSLR